MSSLDELINLLAGKSKEELDKFVKESSSKVDIGPFVPNPGPQTSAYLCQADELFYGGAAGGGKSCLAVGLPLNSHHRGIVFRREYPQIRGLVDEVARMLGTRDGYNGQERLWKLPGGRTLEFGSVQHEDDKSKFQGRAHDYAGFDELPTFTESQYRFLIGWVRSTKPGQRVRIVATGNPPLTAEGLWVCEYWGPWLNPAHPNPAEPGELRWFTSINGQDREMDGPGPHVIDGKSVMARSRTFIPARLEDNPDLFRTGYAATIEAMQEPERTMLREGRFDLLLKQEEDSVIPVHWIMAAQGRWKPDGGKDVPMSCIAFDAAGGGKDEAVIIARHGGWYAPPKKFQGKITLDARCMAAEIIKIRRDNCPVVIDLGGGYGGSTKLCLDENGIEVIGFDGGAGFVGISTDGNRYKFKNKRAGSMWRMREALDPNGHSPEYISLPPDARMRADLCAARWKRSEGVGALVVAESKDAIRSRIGRSTDTGDPVIMALSAGTGAGKSGKPFNRGNVYPINANVANAALKARLRRVA